MLDHVNKCHKRGSGGLQPFMKDHDFLSNKELHNTQQRTLLVCLFGVSVKGLVGVIKLAAILTSIDLLKLVAVDLWILTNKPCEIRTFRCR